MEEQTARVGRHQPATFFALVNHPLKMRLYLLRNVPAAFFSGVRLEQASAARCRTSVPFQWLTQNPFRSTYFASLSMAAELSTGILAMAQVQGLRPAVRLIITAMEANFLRKATERIYFTCSDSSLLAEAVAATLETGVATEARVCATGETKAGEAVAVFWFTWSFKVK